MPSRPTAVATFIVFSALLACAPAPPRSSTPGTTTDPKVGKADDKPPSPELSVRFSAADGSTFNIAEIPGEVKVLNFWATWCKPCIEEMPTLNELSKKYAPKGVTFVGVSIDENGAADAEPFLKSGKIKVDFRVAYAKVEALEPLDVAPPIPDTLVVDKSNKVVAHFDKMIEKAELEQAILKALGEPAR